MLKRVTDGGVRRRAPGRRTRSLTPVRGMGVAPALQHISTHDLCSRRESIGSWDGKGCACSGPIAATTLRLRTTRRAAAEYSPKSCGSPADLGRGARHVVAGARAVNGRDHVARRAIIAQLRSRLPLYETEECWRERPVSGRPTAGTQVLSDPSLRTGSHDCGGIRTPLRSAPCALACYRHTLRLERGRSSVGLEDWAARMAGRARRVPARDRTLSAHCARPVPQCRATETPLSSSHQQAAPAADRAFARLAGIRCHDYASVADDRASATSERNALQSVHLNGIACDFGDTYGSHSAERAVALPKRCAIAARLPPHEPRAAVRGSRGRDSRPLVTAAKSLRHFLQHAIAAPSEAPARRGLGVAPPICRAAAWAIAPGDASTSRSTPPSGYVRRRGPAWPLALGRDRFPFWLEATPANDATCAPRVFSSRTAARSVNVLTSSCASAIAFLAGGNAERSWRGEP